MKLYIIILSTILLFSCHKPNEKEIGQDRVIDYLKNIQKKNDYKPILFGELDSAFTLVNDTELYKEYNLRRGAFEAMEILNEQFPGTYSENEVKSNKEQEMYFRAICDSLELAFTPEFVGWKIQHIYEYKNSRGQHVVDNHIFFIDKEKQRIVKDEQIYTNLPYKTYSQGKTFYGLK